MHDLVYELKQLAQRHREGSYQTQHDRKDLLMLCGQQLVEAGYRHLHAEGIKGRHVNALLARWRTQGLSASTIKNRMSVLRWWARHVGNPGAVLARNDAYGIPQRQTVARVSKARDLPTARLVQVRDAYVRMSLELQLCYGLRRCEAIKIKPWQADRGHTLVLQGSWTKGGRPREIPIRTVEQREALDRAKALVRFKGASLIPSDKTYVEQLRRYESQTARAGLSKLHGLRHRWAQQRYADLTGFACAAQQGPLWAQMTPEQRELDQDARAIISTELGHSRVQITVKYLGR